MINRKWWNLCYYRSVLSLVDLWQAGRIPDVAWICSLVERLCLRSTLLGTCLEGRLLGLILAQRVRRLIQSACPLGGTLPLALAWVVHSTGASRVAPGLVRNRAYRLVTCVEVVGFLGVLQGLHGLLARLAPVGILHESYRGLALDGGEATAALTGREGIRLGVVRECICLERLWLALIVLLHRKTVGCVSLWVGGAVWDLRTSLV